MSKKITILIFVLLLFINSYVFAYEKFEEIEPYEYTNEFKQWIKLPNKENSIMPRPFDAIKTNYIIENPIKLTQSLGNSALPKFNLRDIIPENLVVKNQGQTLACWAFASIASFETNLALNNYYNNNPVKEYNFSEQHLLYGTTRSLGGEINKYGINKNIRDGGNYLVSSSYYSSQIGPVNEESMPYNTNFETKSFSEIINIKPVARLYDYSFLPTYNPETNNLNDVKSAIKNHIKTYGGVEAAIYGAKIESEYYNNTTGALYCDDAENYPYDHDVLIIGWDDSYSKNNFNQEHRPQNNGAWIIKNSWGTRLAEYTFDQMRTEIMANVEKEKLEAAGIHTKEDISDEIVERFFTELGYEVEDGNGYLKLGDNGFMYVSYEDANIYKILGAVQKAADTINYDYVYQYDYAPAGGTGIAVDQNELYLGTVFEKQSNEVEYLNEVAFTNNETVECKVFVNPNGLGMSPDDLQEVELKEGNTKKIDPGYHTLELLNPVEINSNEFSVVLYIKGNRADALEIILEAPIESVESLKYIEVEDGKCFFARREEFQENQWYDCSKLYQLSDGAIPNADTTIKAFTTKYNGSNNNNNDNNNDDENNNEKPQEDNDSFDNAVIPMKISNATSKVVYSKAFYFTDQNEREYMEIGISVDDIEKSLNNDSNEYYYYISQNSNENAIEESRWVKILEKQDSSNTIAFTVDTRNIDNYSDLLKADDLYLYIKEIAKKGTNSEITISNGIKLRNTVQSEIYRDNIKQDDNKISDNVQGQTETKDAQTVGEKQNDNSTSKQNQEAEKDATISSRMLPKAGIGIFIIIILVASSVFTIILYKRYKFMNI